MKDYKITKAIFALNMTQNKYSKPDMLLDSIYRIMSGETVIIKKFGRSRDPYLARFEKCLSLLSKQNFEFESFVTDFNHRHVAEYHFKLKAN